MLRRRRPPDPLAGVDPRAVPPHLAGIVGDALAARARWTATAARFTAGPLRDRAQELTEQVNAGVLSVWASVQRLTELERVTEAMDVARITDEYKRAKRRGGAPPELVAALEAKHRSAQRLLNAVEDAIERLRLLDARLDAAVLQATELLLTGADDRDAGAALGEVLEELTLLQQTMSQLER